MKTEIEKILASPAFQKAAAFIAKDEQKTIEQQLELVQVPAFSNHEEQRADLFQKLLEAEGYSTQRDSVNNVYTVIPGTGMGPVLYVSAHLDTVFPLDTVLKPRREAGVIHCPGIADDTRGLAEILALLRALREGGITPVGTLIMGGNVGEEGLGDLRGMHHFFQSHKDQVDGFISIDGAGPGFTYGATASVRYRVTFRGPGGHSYGDFGCVNPVHAMGRAIAHISELRTPEFPKTTYSVGVVEGGTSVNAIAYECSMLVDMRSDEQGPLDKLHGEILVAIRQGVAEENNRWAEERKWNRNLFGRTYNPDARITVQLEKLGDRPGGSQTIEIPLVQAVVEAYRALGVDPPATAYSSTDSNIPISLGIPAVTVSGGGICGGCHSEDEWYDPTEAYQGTKRILLALLACVGLDGISNPLLPNRDMQCLLRERP